MFHGRKKELTNLQDKIDSHKFEFIVLYGRRRIGKTAILQKIMEQNKQAIYFMAKEKSVEINLYELTQTIGVFFQQPLSFDSYQQLFQYLVDQKQKIILIIDEFTYLLKGNSGFVSDLQEIIDHILPASIIKLIVSGSYVGVMEDELSYQKPLYGRKTFALKIKPFDYDEASLFYPRISSKDKIIFYSIFGGIPFYLRQINPQLSVKQNIIDIILKRFLNNEAEMDFILKHEIQKPQKYIAILQSIAYGATKLNYIRDKSHIKSSSSTANYISTLEKMGIVGKDFSFGERKNSKKTLYYMKDQFFRFYFTFIEPNLNTISFTEEEVFYSKFIEPKLDEYVSWEFEKIAQSFVHKKYVSVSQQIGRYWGNILTSENNKKINKDVEIDIILQKTNKEIFLFECKWSIEKIDYSVVNRLEEKKAILQEKFENKITQIGFFSKSGYDAKIDAHKYLLFTLDDLFSL
ncbi:MAG: ATP-binding protein ['Conium maculatum' witches'-broom phytoplasma]|nr:ATP-binding protein ['Conium maculatum' witches'-broom phytoplasma]